MKELECTGYLIIDSLVIIYRKAVFNKFGYFDKSFFAYSRLSHLPKYDSNAILAIFHYTPLDSSANWEKFRRFHGDDVFTTFESEELVRLPLYYGL